MKKLLIALLVIGLMAPGVAFGQSLESRVSELEEGMREISKEGLKLKEAVIGMKKYGFHWFGSFRTHLGYYDVEQEFVPTSPSLDATIGTYGVDDDSGTQLGLGGNGKFGAKAIANENFSAVLTVGLRSSTRDHTDDTYLRQAYGEWDFGQGKLRMGQSFTPATYLGYSKMGGDVGDTADGNMLTLGLPYIGRQPLIQLSFGDFEIALIEPNEAAPDYQDVTDTFSILDGGVAGDVVTDVDATIPRIELAHVFRLIDNSLRIRPIAGYQTYDVEVFDTTTGETNEESIDSYLFGVGVSADFAPAYVKVTANYHQNAGNYGEANLGTISQLNALGEVTIPSPPALAPTPLFDTSILNAQVLADGSIEDSTLMQGTLVGGVKVNDMVNLEAGFGYMNAELDLPGIVVATLSEFTVAPEVRTAEQTAMTYYAQAWVSISENVSIVPEIGVLDRGDLEVDGLDDIEQGSLTYFDVNFRVDF